MKIPGIFFVSLIVLFSQARLEAATLLWNFPTPSAVLASPTVASDGTIYIAAYDRVVYALNPNGSVKWTNNLPEPTYIYFTAFTAVYGTPAVGGDGTVYVPSENGKLLALNPTNGAIKWVYATPVTMTTNTDSTIDTNYNGLYASPALAADGTIYFGSFDRNLYALNPDGSLKWTNRFGSTIFASPVVGRDGTIYCGCDNGRLYAVDPNGTQRWSFNTGPRPITASPAIGADGRVYIGVDSPFNKRFYSVNTNGTTNWVFTTGGRVESSAALGADGTIYFGCDDQKLYALNPDGTTNWVFTTGATNAAVKSSPAVSADGTIYFGCDDGKLYALSTNGNPVWTFQTTNHVFASPAIGPDGTVYFASDDGTLYVARGCHPPAVSDWPMFRREVGRAGRAVNPLTNDPPVLPTVGDRTAEPDTPLVITNTASDSPGQALSYALGPGAPTGAAIDPATGVFTWTPTSTNALGANEITVWVTDNGSPPLSDVQCFTVVVVVPRPDIQSFLLSSPNAVLSWRSVSSKVYRVQCKTNLEDAVWVDLPGDVTASTNTTTKNILIDSAAEQRFYRVQLLP